MTRLIIPVIVTLTLCGNSLADPTNNFVKFFYTNCVETITDLEALKTYAEIRKWKALPEKFKSVIGGKTDELWGVKEDGQFFMIGSGVSTRNDGRQMNACSVVSKPQDADDVAKILKARLKLNLLVDDVEGYTRWQQFSARVSGVPMMMNIISADSDKKARSVILSAAYIGD